jgi:hypothetical protein
MKKVTLFFCLLIGIVACEPSLKKKREYFIASDSSKYWRLFRKDYPRVKTSGYHFNRDFTFEKYVVRKDDKRLLPPVHGDIKFVASEWELVNDTIMNFGRGVPYKILYITEDSFALQSLTFNEVYIYKFYKEEDQLTPIDKSVPPVVLP